MRYALKELQSTFLVSLIKLVRIPRCRKMPKIRLRREDSSHLTDSPNSINLILLAAHSQPPITKLNSSFEQHLHPRPYHPRGHFGLVSPPRAEHMFFSPVQMHRTQPSGVWSCEGILCMARTHECILHLLQRVRSQQRRR